MADDKNFSLVNLGGAAGDIVKELFGPSARNMGKVFGAVTGLVYSYFRKYEYFNAIEDEIMVKNLREFKEELDKVPEEKIITAPPEITSPIFSRFEYVSSEEIAKAFQNLLLKASNSDTVETAHPGFISVIDRLSSDEAKLLKHIRATLFVRVVHLKMEVVAETNEGKSITFPISDILPEIWITEADLELENELFLKRPRSLYYENLIGLGLIKYKEIYREDSKYDILITKQKELLLDSEGRSILDDDSISAEYVKGNIMLSNYGILFAQCCLDGKSESN